jgi:hypothetical protein
LPFLYEKKPEFRLGIAREPLSLEIQQKLPFSCIKNDHCPRSACRFRMDTGIVFRPEMPAALGINRSFGPHTFFVGKFMGAAGAF